MRTWLLLSTIAVMSLLLHALTPSPPASADAVDLQNAGFEDGAAGWSALGADVDSVDGTTVPPAEGARSGRLTLTADEAQVRQHAGSGPPGTYTLRALVRGGSPGVQVAVAVATTQGTGGASSTASAGADWIEMTASTSTYVTADIVITVRAFGTAGDQVYVDAVRLDVEPIEVPPTAPPAPSTEEAATPGPSVTAAATPSPSATAEPDAMAAWIRNAGFEDLDAGGAPLAWRAYGGSLSSTSSPAHGGARSGRFESATDSTKWIYQPLSVEPGATYAFDAWVLSGGGVEATFLRVSWYASTDASGEAIGTADSTERLSASSGDYRFLTTAGVTAPAGARSAKVRVMLAPVSAAPAIIFVDDASFHAAPPRPPGTAPQEDAAPAAEDPAPAAAASGAPRVAARDGGRRAPLVTRPGAAGPLKINEVLYDPAGPDVETGGEWVELYNAGDAPVSLEGWSLGDGVSIDPLPAMIVAAGGFAVVTASDSFSTVYPEAGATAVAIIGGRIGNGLGNDGDLVALVDPAGALVDAVSWGDDVSAFDPAVEDVPGGHAIERRRPGTDTDTAADFVDNPAPSPGRPFEAGNGNPQPKASAVRVLPAAEGELADRLPWALAALAGAALLVTLGWRWLPALRHRP